MEALFQNITYLGIFVFFIGFGLVMFLVLILSLTRRLQAKSEAKWLIEEAEERAKEIEDEHKKRANNYAEGLKERLAEEVEIAEERIGTLEGRIRAQEEKLEERLSEVERAHNEHRSNVDSYAHRVQNIENRVQQRRDVAKTMREDYVKRLAAKTEAAIPDLKKTLQEKAKQDLVVEMGKLAPALEEEAQKQAEVDAKRLLNMAINRFARPYCPERGIGYLNFESEEQKNRVLGPEQKNLRELEKLCGVDLAYDETNNAVNVYGFDPVRRELGRASVEKLMNDRNVQMNKLDQLVSKTKKDLMKRIMNDGNRIANELRIDGLHQEVKNMMGALRYRYSFTQNQHFHCGEVGFLAGLLAAELGVPIRDARRSGLLHDIGKAMDHSIEGGHAVIGADFIRQHGEADHIVHAVRAHHFDETPSTDMAYLVIAADAMSGARPGARRSTAATYTQKIQDLQTIGRGFEGVIDTHVLSAGRELRVYVDGRTMDDLKALQLSKDIAHKIETEMQYPGQIKVTVVRETQAVEYAR